MRHNKELRNRAQRQSPAARELVELNQRLALSASEVGAVLGKSPTTIYRLLYRGLLRAVANGGRLLIPRAELDRYLATAAEYNPQSKSNSDASENGGEK